MRLSRHCYDKPHRCPGWAGGGTRYPKGESRCESGRLQINYEDRWYRWRFHRCNKCDVAAWPIVVQELDWTWWRWRFHGWFWKLKDWYQDRQYR